MHARASHGDWSFAVPPRSAGVLGAVLIAVVLIGGCTSKFLVARTRLVPGTVLGKSEVYLQGGEIYQFRRITFKPDTLLGEYPISVEHGSVKEGIYYTTEARVFPVPISKVDSVRVVSRDPGKTVLLAAGAVAVGFVVKEVTDTSGLNKTSVSSGGKDSGTPQ